VGVLDAVGRGGECCVGVSYRNGVGRCCRNTSGMDLVLHKNGEVAAVPERLLASKDCDPLLPSGNLLQQSINIHFLFTCFMRFSL
jgi:hypothetical protein